ncbi:MAG: GSCFA domain-containing protein [Paludibacteraceae bacterium]|nr:GSCFA domain-containing protein [Paludibacteraceae bacterium]
MKFRTETKFAAKGEISYRDNLMFIGSCFSENIGTYFERHLFRTDLNNPFGILFNPASIAKAVRRLLSETPYSDNDLFLHNGVWNSYDHHSDFSDTEKEKCLAKMNDKLKESSQFLKNATILFITFGTAWIYRQKVNGQIVSNCHKMPANTFLREKLSVQDIVNEYTDLFHTFPFSDKKTRVIFTVSPVRHTKDGLHENQLSKATLLLAIDELQKRFDFVEYFPSYEMLLDDLRDYRFYNEDMVHPNNTAIKYLTEKLSSYFSEETKMLMNEAEQIASAESHRPFNPKSNEYQSFISSIHEKKSQLMTKIANIRKR